MTTTDATAGSLTVDASTTDPGGTVRIHVDNRFVGETTAGADGRWAFAAGQQIPSGRLACTQPRSVSHWAPPLRSMKMVTKDRTSAARVSRVGMNQ